MGVTATAMRVGDLSDFERRVAFTLAAAARGVRAPGSDKFMQSDVDFALEGVLALKAVGLLARDPAENKVGPSQTHSRTSRAAALRNYPRSGSQRARILSKVIVAGEEGMTREEIAHWVGLPDNSVRPRVIELVRGGWLEEAGRTRKSKLGNDSEVLVASERAVLAAS